MDKKFCIFDMDGTLVDSMGYWRGLGFDYLGRRGIDRARIEAAMEKVHALTLVQSAQLMLDEFGLPGTPADVLGEMRELMEEHYRHDVEVKAGIREYLDKLKDQGCRLCVATATDAALSRLCLERLGLADDFEFLLSCQTKGVGKTQPDIYLEAAAGLGAQPEDCAVFEDALYAARTAKAAGFYTVAVWDQSMEKDWVELKELADESVLSWKERI